MVKTLHFQFRGCWFDPWSGLRSHRLHSGGLKNKLKKILKTIKNKKHRFKRSLSQCDWTGKTKTVTSRTNRATRTWGARIPVRRKAQRNKSSSLSCLSSQSTHWFINKPSHRDEKLIEFRNWEAEQRQSISSDKNWSLEPHQAEENY